MTELSQPQKDAIDRVTAVIVLVLLLVLVAALAVHMITYHKVVLTYDDSVCVESKLVPHWYGKYRARGQMSWKSTVDVGGTTITLHMKLELGAHYKVVVYENFSGNEHYVLTQKEDQ